MENQLESQCEKGKYCFLIRRGATHFQGLVAISSNPTNATIKWQNWS